MELNTLRVMIKVAELGNISQAALALGLTQPTVSRIIATVEKDFGGPLFYRTGRGVTLTEIGEAALPRARAIVTNSEQLAADMRDLVHSPSGVVSIAMLPSQVNNLAGELYEQARRQFPGIRLRLLEGFSSQIEEWLNDGRAEIALLSRYQERPSADEEILHKSQLMLVGIAGTARKRETVAFSELRNIPLVLPAVPNGLRMAVDDASRRRNVKLNVVAEADSLLAQRAILHRQGCYAVLSAQTVDKEIRQGLFEARRIVDPALPRLIVMMTTTQRPLSRAAREVARIVRRLAVESAG